MKRMRNLILVGALLVGVSACSDDDDSSSDTKTTEAADDGGDTADTAAADGESSGNPDVVAYCEETADLAEALEEVLADPTKGDIAALTTQATELVAAAAQLTSANPDDVDEINACNQALNDALTPG